MTNDDLRKIFSKGSHLNGGAVNIADGYRELYLAGMRTAALFLEQQVPGSKRCVEAIKGMYEWERHVCPREGPAPKGTP